MAEKALFSKQEKLLLFALAALQVCHIVDFMIIMPLGPQLMKAFAIAPHQFGLLVSSYTFAAGVSGFVSTFFVDKIDRKKMLLFFHLGFTIGTLACAFSKGYSGLLIARSITGLFGGVLSSLVLSIVGDAIGPDRRATAMGTIMAGFSVASIAGVPFSLYLANLYDWHTPFIFLGGLAVALAILIMKALPPMTAHLVGKVENESPFEPFKRILGNRNQLIALWFMVLLVFGQFTVIPFIADAMVSNAGLTPEQVPLIYLVGGVCAIFSGPIVGRWADKSGKKKVFLISATVSLIPLILLTHMGKNEIYVVLSVIALFFVCMSGRMVPATALVTSTVKPQFRGSFMSVVSCVQQFSLAAASYLAGLMVWRGPTGTLENYSMSGYVAVMASILAILANQLIVPVEGDQK